MALPFSFFFFLFFFCPSFCFAFARSVALSPPFLAIPAAASIHWVGLVWSAPLAPQLLLADYRHTPFLAAAANNVLSKLG